MQRITAKFRTRWERERRRPAPSLSLPLSPSLWKYILAKFALFGHRHRSGYCRWLHLLSHIVWLCTHVVAIVIVQTIFYIKFIHIYLDWIELERDRMCIRCSLLFVFSFFFYCTFISVIAAAAAAAAAAPNPFHWAPNWIDIAYLCALLLFLPYRRNDDADPVPIRYVICIKKEQSQPHSRYRRECTYKRETFELVHRKSQNGDNKNKIPNAKKKQQQHENHKTHTHTQSHITWRLDTRTKATTTKMQWQKLMKNVENKIALRPAISWTATWCTSI